MVFSRLRQDLRYPSAVLASLLVTVLIFLFMHRLISGDPLRIDTDNLMVSVDIYQPPPESKPQEPPPEEVPPVVNSQPVAEPTLAPLSVSAPTPTPQLKVGGPPVPSFAPSFDDVALESGSGSIFGSGFGDAGGTTWTGSGGDNRELAKKIAEADRKGAEGYREIVPFGTRQPNVPEAAWNSKTDGWVLVTFSVNTRGKVENVRVLDSQPPGLFDANVVAAVSDWIYDPADIQGRKVKVQLTQRIEMHWKDYPHNNQQLR